MRPPPDEIPATVCGPGLLVTERPDLVVTMMAPLAYSSGVELRVLIWAHPGMLTGYDLTYETPKARAEGLHLNARLTGSPTEPPFSLPVIGYSAGLASASQQKSWLPLSESVQAVQVEFTWARMGIQVRKDLDLTAIRAAQARSRIALHDWDNRST